MNTSSSFAGEGLGMQTQVGLLKLLFARPNKEKEKEKEEGDVEVNENFGNIISQAI